MRRWHALTFVFAYLFLDVSFSILPLALYNCSKRGFDISLIFKYLLLLDGYSFTETPIDFVVITNLRLFILAVAVLVKIVLDDSQLKKLILVLLPFSLFSWAFSIIKLLAFSEHASAILYCAGPWLSVLWNITATVLLLAVWQLVLMSSASWHYAALMEYSSDGSVTGDDTSAQQTLSDSSRQSTFDHAIALLKYCKAQWKWFTAGFIFLIIQSVARIFLPYLTGQVIANIVQTRGYQDLVRSVIWMAVLSVFFDGLRGGCFDYATALVNRQMRCDLFRSLVKQEIGFFDTTKTGEITSRLTSDCATMSSTVSTNLNTFLRNGLMLIGALVIMFVLSWRLTMVTFMIVPIVAFATRTYGIYYDKLSERTHSMIACANQIAEEVMSTMRTVRSFACEKKQATRFENSLDDVVKISKKRSTAFIGYTWTNAGCDHVIEVAVLLYGGHLVISGRMTADNLIAFLLYQMQLGENLYYLGTVFAGLMESVGASRKVFEYMSREPAVANTGVLKCSVSGSVRFDRVSFTYPSRPNNRVLKDMSFTIDPGETVALVGPSGGGKSSIVALIEHFYNADSGDIFIDNVSIRDFNHEYIHQKIALVAQEPILYEGSVRYNILYGWEENGTEEAMIKAAKMANVHDFVMETENGYDTNCGEKGVQLSGGQKQRIAIARALVRDPAVLILDEATSALDSENEHIVQEAIAACSKQRTVIVIAHRLSTVEKADRIIVIDNGTIVQQGRHVDLIQKNGIYKALVQRQLLVQRNVESDVQLIASTD
ncbi:unnamed protein product [Anisakis simplex]|uniref:ATP-binding cassette sub-family B member 9 (inferred by orthology to a human protein) n=1 Tax=Anisakis simplex TaxID=6269 RepID=A0A0M3JSB8_ANISI|nr:unnamed protein product [Anisakis simplex]